MYQSNESNYSIDHGQPLTNINQENLLSSNDDIKKTICDPDTLIAGRTSETVFLLDNNELNFIESRNLEIQEAVQDTIDTIVNESVSINEIPVISPCTSYLINNSDNFTLNDHCQTAQATVPKNSLTSLQFVHDVHPYKKTQHDKDIIDNVMDKSHLSYVMRIQGYKTKVDKGKTVLPRLKSLTYKLLSSKLIRSPLIKFFKSMFQKLA
ncbi:unnamed protein product [Rotaria sp. Silwood2]|nr:unnamed protein product [Rotaria sp. Silwood2]CAF2912938.1 unnamed protein product [Rotaria sp. Silwood2]CAF3014439.1 unnamed protein product [Rotaria sp. Silwood2]CAF3156310.1 unnamed protein product [Rotaria sp. Silwood2]CAF4359493.1 unnamed protein product [Rotaria sp. Silwood2]